VPQAVAAGAIKTFFVKLIIAIAVNVIVNKVTKAMQKRPVRQLQKVDVSYSGGLQPRRILYGNFRAGGLELMPASVSGFNGERLNKCVALSDGEIGSIDSAEINNDTITSAQWNTSTGVVSSGPYAGYIRIYPKLGLASQASEPAALQAAGWSVDHRGDGIAYVYLFFTASNDVYKSGAPTVVVFNGTGKKIYDPRLDTSPGAHPTTSTYVAFSTNPANILADFLTWYAGGSEAPAKVLWSDVVTAANACDGSVTIPNGSGGTTTQSRYTCSIEVFAPQTQKERDDTIAMLARAMMGACWFADGVWHMRAGVYTSPVASFTDDDFLGDSLNIATAQSRAQSGIFNTVRGSFTDQSQKTQPRPFPEVSSSSFIASDGEVLYTDAEFFTARTTYEAQRNAILLLRQSRRRIIVSGTMRFKASGLQLYDVVNLTLTKLGWVSQTVRVIRIRHFQNFTVAVEFQEIASGDFTDPTTVEYTVPGAVAPITSTSYVPNPPSNLRATSLTSAILLEWDPPTNPPVGVVYRVYMYSSPTPFSSATAIGSETGQTSVVVPRTDTSVSYFWVVAIDPANRTTSTQAPPTNGVPGNAATASSALSAVVTPGSATASGSSSTQTSNSVAVTAVGGTAPYTYLWTFTAGGTGITITSSTSASTTFSAAGLAEGDVKSGTARCRVTDNVSATYDVYVSVNLSRTYAVSLSNKTLNAYGSASGAYSGGSPAVATATLTPTGSFNFSDGTSQAWASSGVTASNFEVRFTVVSGTLESSSSATGVWLNLASGRGVVGVRVPSAGVGTSTQIVTVEIRDASTLTVLATATLTMNEIM
jgi:hypothetical protein